MNKLMAGTVHALRNLVEGRRKGMLYWNASVLKHLAFSWPRVRREAETFITNDFFQNHLSLPETERRRREEALLAGLDEESRSVIEQTLTRHQYIYTHNVIEQKKIFSAEELRDQKTYFKELPLIMKKARGLAFRDFASEAFVFQSGFLSLPSEKRKRLEDGLIIDGGAFVGDSSFGLKLAYPRCKIIAFEPQTENFQLLTKNTAGLAGVSVIKAGLSDGEKQSAKIASDGSSSRIGDEGEEIKLVSLDSYVRETGLNRIDAIKLDLEGAEQSALKGMTDTIRSFRPLLSVAIYHNASDFFSIKPYIESLGLNYKFKVVKANPFSLTHEVMLLAWPL